MTSEKNNNTPLFISDISLVQKLKNEIKSEFPNVYNTRIGRRIFKELKDNPACVYEQDFQLVLALIKMAIRKELSSRPCPAIPTTAKKPNLDEIESRRDEGYYASKYGSWWFLK